MDEIWPVPVVVWPVPVVVCRRLDVPTGTGHTAPHVHCSDHTRT